MGDRLLRLLRRVLPGVYALRTLHIARRGRVALQRDGEAFLADFLAAAGEAGMRPFLIWGTLLGAIREDGFLRTDRDIDIGILHPDYARRQELIAAMARRGYPLTKDWRYKLRFGGPARGVHIDVDVLYPFGDEMICTAPHREGGIYGARFPAAALHSFRETTMLGGRLAVSVPEPPERLLEAMYGPGWRVPDPDYDSSKDLHNRLRIGPDEPMPPFPG